MSDSHSAFEYESHRYLSLCDKYREAPRYTINKYNGRKQLDYLGDHYIRLIGLESGNFYNQDCCEPREEKMGFGGG